MWFSTFTSVLEPELQAQVEVDWAEMLNRLEGHKHPAPSFIDKDVKKSMPCWAPVKLKDGKTRSNNQNIEEIHALVLDFDGTAMFDDVLELWGDWACWIHTTTGHSPEAHRCRVVLKLSRPLMAKEFKPVWLWAEKRSSSAGIKLDIACKDPRRLWLFPYPGRFNYESVEVEGDPLDVSLIISGAMEPEAQGAPAGVPTEFDDVVFHTEDGPTTPANWAKSAKVGDAVKGYCPRLSEEQWKSPSAWMRKRASGVFVGCSSDHHGHEVPLRLWFPNEETQGKGKPQQEKSIHKLLEWKTDREGNRIGIKSTKHNLLVILRGDPRLASRMWFDSFANRVVLDGAPINDNSQMDFQAEVEWVYGLEFNKQTFWDAIQAAVRHSMRNPLQEELESFEWDGVTRIDTWLSQAFGVQDSDLARKLGRCWLIQAVARAMDPGCKADTVLVLVGGQGEFKSSTLEDLAGKAWFSDTGLHFGTRQVYLQIQAKWIYELGELTSVRKSDVETVKQFLSASVDDYVPPYGMHTVTSKRHCVFVATTNEQQFLVDETGNRRFWPVSVGAINRRWVHDNRGQLWAEALRAYKAGEQWWLQRADERLLQEAQAEYEEIHPWEDIVRQWAATTTVPAVTCTEILMDVIPGGERNLTTGNSMRIATMLRKFGWRSKQVRTGATTKTRAYFNPGVPDREALEFLKNQKGGFMVLEGGKE